MFGLEVRLRRGWRLTRKCLLLAIGNFSQAFGGVVDENLAGKIRAEQWRSVVGHTVSMMAATMLNGAILVAALGGTADPLSLVAWTFALLSGVGLVMTRRLLARARPRPTRTSPRTIRRICRNAFIAGVTWGAAPPLFYMDASQGGKLVLTCICAGMIGGGALAFGSVPAAAVAMIAPIAGGSIWALWRSGEAETPFIIALLASYCFVLIRASMLHAFNQARQFISRTEIEQLASRDPLTGLDNIAVFRGAATEAMLRLERAGEPFALFLVDIDDLKKFNEQHGHAAGDALLVALANRMRGLARRGERIARIDGDQFAILSPGLAGEATLRACAARLAKMLGEPYEFGGVAKSISVCVGVFAAQRGVADARTVMRNAELALLKAQRKGRGSFHVFGAGDDAALLERQAMEEDLRLALARGEFHLEFQPMYRLASRKVEGFEALLRWRHPARGLVPPSVFIPIAEEHDLIEPIGGWVLRAACAAAASWPRDVRVCVNVSARQLRTRALCSQVAILLEEFGLEPDRLEIEITESVLVSDDALPLEILTELSKRGVTLALDDFGTGYSSLGYLRRLPFDRIKIDRSFVSEICEDRDSAAIVKSVIGLARDLGMEVTAEGIETVEQLECLRALDCPEVQGYLIGRPMAEDRVDACLRAGVTLAAA